MEKTEKVKQLGQEWSNKLSLFIAYKHFEGRIGVNVWNKCEIIGNIHDNPELLTK